MIKPKKTNIFNFMHIIAICVMFSFVLGMSVYADEGTSELDGTWELAGIVINDDLKLASEIGMTGNAVIQNSIIMLSVSSVDDSLIGIISSSTSDGIYTISDGKKLIGGCGLSDEYLMVVLFGNDDESMTLFFTNDSSNNNSSGYSNTYSNSYSSGTYIVGEDIPAGEYVFFSDSNTDGYFAVYGEKYSSDIKENDLFSYNSIMNINTGEKIKLERCYAVPIGSAVVKTDGEGMFKIGTHLSAGNYHLKATTNDDAYYCIYSDNEHNHIRENDLFEGDAYIRVSAGEYLVVERCRIIE